MWIRLYQKQAFQDFGTLQQLQSLINRSNVPVKPKNNVNAAEDFLQVNVKIYLIMYTEGYMHNYTIILFRLLWRGMLLLLLYSTLE